ncbi:MAG: hypothetical protein ACREMQ_24310 [Longimicrobiales bacterium]
MRRANRSLTLAAQLQVAPRTDPPCDHSYVAHLSLVFLMICVATLAAQPVPVNLGLDEGEPGQTPKGWSSPRYLAEWRSEGCHSGSGCAVIFRTASAAPNSFTKKVIFRAVRVEPLDGEGRGQLWFRVNRANQSMGFFDNI